MCAQVKCIRSAAPRAAAGEIGRGVQLVGRVGFVLRALPGLREPFMLASTIHVLAAAASLPSVQHQQPTSSSAAVLAAASLSGGGGGGCPDTATLEHDCGGARNASVGNCLVCMTAKHGEACSGAEVDGFCSGPAAAAAATKPRFKAVWNCPYMNAPGVDFAQYGIVANPSGSFNGSDITLFCELPCDPPLPICLFLPPFAILIQLSLTHT